MKKLVIADLLAPFVQAVFQNYGRYTGYYILMAVFLYAIQIYCDFSGCTVICCSTDCNFFVCTVICCSTDENFQFCTVIIPYRSPRLRSLTVRFSIFLSVQSFFAVQVKISNSVQSKQPGWLYRFKNFYLYSQITSKKHLKWIFLTVQKLIFENALQLTVQKSIFQTILQDSTRTNEKSGWKSPT